MAFPRRLLRDGEKMVLDLRPHPIAIAFNVIVAIAALAVMTFVLIKHVKWLHLPVVILAVGVILFVSLPGIVGWLTSHFVVTSERVISRNGWISKHEKDIPLDRVQNIMFSQSVFERLIGAGDLTLESAGEESDTKFTDVRNPEHVQKTIYVVREQDEQRRISPVAPPAPAPTPPAAAPAAPPAAVPPAAAPAPFASTADELAKLADLRDKGVISDTEFQAQKARLLGS